MRCRKCERDLHEDCFYKSLKYRCKECHKSLCKKYVFENTEKRVAYKKEYYTSVIINRRSERKKLKPLKPPGRPKIILSEDELIEKKKHRKKVAKAWAQANRHKLNSYIKKKELESPEYKLERRVRASLIIRLKRHNSQKCTKTWDLIGCTISQLMHHIELQFTPGMTWENHSRDGWHIDHIIPVSHFDMSDQEQQKQCFHYSNLQPLWAADNLKKRDKVLDSKNIPVLW